MTLHSKRWTSAAKAAQRLPQDVDLLAVDIPDPAQLRLPSWETSRLLARTVFERRTDTQRETQYRPGAQPHARLVPRAFPR